MKEFPASSGHLLKILNELMGLELLGVAAGRVLQRDTRKLYGVMEMFAIDGGNGFVHVHISQKLANHKLKICAVYHTSIILQKKLLKIN